MNSIVSRQINSVLCTAALIVTLLPIQPSHAATSSKVLSYLNTISGLKTISGQHNREPNSDPAKWTTWIYTVTGVYPGMWGGDFLYLYDDVQPHNRWKMITEAKSQWDSGSLVTLTWHACPPHYLEHCDWEGGIKSDLSDAQWNELVTNNTTLNNQWKQRIDTIVPYLQYLKDNGVEVLWRPLHEMNDDWCWWCGRRGANGSRKLYEITCDYMKNTKGLTNLIWVWNVKDVTTTLTTTMDLTATLEYYPDDDCVDVISLDPWNNWEFPKGNYDVMLAIAKSKPMAIGETARLPSPRVLAEQPRWTWFLGWAELVQQYNSEEEIRRIYHDCRVVNRGLMRPCTSWLPIIRNDSCCSSCCPTGFGADGCADTSIANIVPVGRSRSTNGCCPGAERVPHATSNAVFRDYRYHREP